MKFKFIITVLLVAFSQVHAQKITLNKLKEIQIQNFKKNIEFASIYGDSPTRIQNMVSIIAIEGENSSYKDSLALAYFQNNSFLSAHLLSKELLVKKPNDILLSEINAVSLTRLNATKEAIDAYEKLFSLTKKMSDAYQLAYLQYSIKRLAEAKSTIVKAINCETQEAVFLEFPVDKNSNQNVPLKAAAFNLKGLISFELKDNMDANSSFKEALKVMPEFATATQNANAVLVTMQNEKKNTEKEENIKN